MIHLPFSNTVSQAAFGYLLLTVQHLCYFGTSCHARGHWHFPPFPYRECYGFERVFFTLSRFFFRPFLLLSRPPWCREFTLNCSWASCCLSKHSLGRNICLNHRNPQKRYNGRFYLTVRAGRLRNEESAFYWVWTLFAIGEYVRSLMLYLFGHRALQTVID